MKVKPAPRLARRSAPGRRASQPASRDELAPSTVKVTAVSTAKIAP